MMKLLIILPVVLFASACSKQDDIRGTFINENSEEISIDCNFQIKSTRLSNQPMMPENGDEIKLSTQEIKQEIVQLSFIWDDILFPFATWNSRKDEIVAGKDIYVRKSFAKCNK